MTRRPPSAHKTHGRQAEAVEATRHLQGPSLGRSGREIAYESLSAVDERPVFLRTVLDELCNAFDVSGRDRALALEIAAGVTRRRATLDTVINAHLRNAGGRIESRLRTVLRMGVYQLLFLAIPPHAAVHEMVELARRAQPRWTRLVNGVLRAVQRDLTAETVEAPQVDAFPVCLLQGASAPSADGNTDPFEPAVRIEYRRLHSSPFPSPIDDLASHVAAAFSLPAWLAVRWQQRFGDAELLRLAAWFATPGRTSLRVNPRRSTVGDVLKQLDAIGVSAVAGDRPDAIRLLDNVRIDRIAGFSEGQFSVQDESAQAAVELLDPQPGQQVLDLCAAPGGKSTALAERMGNQGRIIAADTDAARVALIVPGAARLGLTIIEPVVIRSDSSDVPAGPFDRILLDVPCSNTGVLGKRPEARWRISETGIAELAATQNRLLNAALDRLAAGGHLVYSTCSIEPEENEELVCRVLAGRGDLALVSEAHHRPGRPADGGYQALIRRTNG